MEIFFSEVKRGWESRLSNAFHRSIEACEKGMAISSTRVEEMDMMRLSMRSIGTRVIAKAMIRRNRRFVLAETSNVADAKCVQNTAEISCEKKRQNKPYLYDQYP
jgi:hypothetical protein